MVFIFIKAKIATSTQVEFHQLSVVIHPLHVLVLWLFGMYSWSYQYIKYTKPLKYNTLNPPAHPDEIISFKSMGWYYFACEVKMLECSAECGHWDMDSPMLIELILDLIEVYHVPLVDQGGDKLDICWSKWLTSTIFTMYMRIVCNTIHPEEWERWIDEWLLDSEDPADLFCCEILLMKQDGNACFQVSRNVVTRHEVKP